MRQRRSKTKQAFCSSATASLGGHSLRIGIEMSVLGGWVFLFIFFFSSCSFGGFTYNFPFLVILNGVSLYTSVACSQGVKCAPFQTKRANHPLITINAQLGLWSKTPTSGIYLIVRGPSADPVPLGHPYLQRNLP